MIENNTLRLQTINKKKIMFMENQYLKKTKMTFMITLIKLSHDFFVKYTIKYIHFILF
jgi:hypothetical protein